MNTVILQNASKIKLPSNKKLFTTWVNQALTGYGNHLEILIRIVDIKEMIKLNSRYRRKNKPTNILSFQFEPPPGIKTNHLGDLVICAPLVKIEAKPQHKTIMAHLAHLTIHGALHLLGYDHKTTKEAQVMEALEIKHLKKLGFANPYYDL